MIELEIPGRGVLRLQHLVIDVNGTLAVDGRLIDGVAKSLLGLSDRLQIHLLTADMHGRQAILDQQLGLTAVRIPAGGEAQAKGVYTRELGAGQVVALGQGANDVYMLQEAALGICILGPEGTAVEALMAADVVAPCVLDALDLLYQPLRLVATMRR
jgi:soluble P-type ATPase